MAAWGTVRLASKVTFLKLKIFVIFQTRLGEWPALLPAELGSKELRSSGKSLPLSWRPPCVLSNFKYVPSSTCLL